MGTDYFVFDVNGRQTGLVRRTRDDEAKTLTLEYVSDGQWFDDPDLIRYFEGFGGDQTDVVSLTREEARAQAERLGVAL
jgi:hypothetical protein